MLAAARAAMPDADVVDAAWLEEYDAYYYDRDVHQGRSRCRCCASATRIRSGRGCTSIRARRHRAQEERLTRVNRWLYHGLHSLDFPFCITVVRSGTSS